MNEQQRDIIIGSILGDAYVNPSGGITFPASIKHLDYLQWKRDMLIDLGAGEITRHDKYDARYDRVYSTCRFYLGRQKQFRSMFYLDGVKVFPDVTLTPLSFAVWFLDDGGCVNRCSFSIATNGFAAEDIDRAIDALRSVNLIGRRTSDGRITLGAVNKSRVVSFVKRIMVPSMLHKIDVRPDAVLVDKVTKKCPVCGNSFLSYASDNMTYCSRKCAFAMRASGYATRDKTATCPICNRIYKVYNRRQESCMDCRDKPLPHEICIICGKPAISRGSKTCSRRCNVIAGHRARKAAV